MSLQEVLLTKFSLLSSFYVTCCQQSTDIFTSSPHTSTFQLFFVATQMLSGNREQRFGKSTKFLSQKVQKLTFKLESVLDLSTFVPKKL